MQYYLSVFCKLSPYSVCAKMTLPNLSHSRTGWEQGFNVKWCKDFRTCHKQSSQVFCRQQEKSFSKISGGLARVLGFYKFYFLDSCKYAK